MKEIEVLGLKLHFARNEREWKREIDKKYDYDTKYYERHHIIEVGKCEKLRYCVENGIKIQRDIHLMQKSLDYEVRVRFQKLVRMMTDPKIWEVLHKIRDYSRISPKSDELVGEQVHGT